MMQTLVQERERAVALVASLAEELDAIIALSMTETPDDEHDSEGSTIGFERARVAALLAHSRRRVVELDLALDRVRAGTYGVCARCADPISVERLEALPTTETCVSCAATT